MPTLLLKGTFSFYKDAIVTDSLKSLIESLPSLQIIIKIINMKLQGHHRYDHVYFLNGRTGSGKSTLFIATLYNEIIQEIHGRLICSEPRVILTKSNAIDVVRHDNNFVIGKNIGILTGSERLYCISRDSLYYCTTQILNDQLVSILHTKDIRRAKNKLKSYKLIVIDEVHILDLPMMALLKTILDILDRFGELEECPIFIFASATIDVLQLAKYYFRDDYIDVLKDPLMIGEVIGEPNYSIEKVFISDSDMKKYNEIESKQGGMSGYNIVANYFYNTYYNTIYNSDSYITHNEKRYQCRDVLIFVPLVMGIQTIANTLINKIKDRPVFFIDNGMTIDNVTEWRRKNNKKQRILIIGFARNYSPASDEILSNPIDVKHEYIKYETKIIISTPIVDTGKTISTLKLCIDTGIQTQTVYNPLAFKFSESKEYLKQIPINIKQCIQREGRVGREAPGTFVHFYSESIMNKFNLYDTPDTINNVCLSNLLIDTFKSKNVGVNYDLINENDYLYPITVDILIRSIHDLIYSGYFSVDGKFIKNNNMDIWLSYANYIYSVLGYSLFDSLMLAAINRKYLMSMYSIREFSVKDLRYNNLKNLKPTSDVIDGIKLARNTLTAIMYSNKKILPLIKNRLYNKRSNELFSHKNNQYIENKSFIDERLTNKSIDKRFYSFSNGF